MSEDLSKRNLINIVNHRVDLPILDLHGCPMNLREFRINSFIDDLVALNENVGIIIDATGTGRIQQECLKNNKNVEDFVYLHALYGKAIAFSLKVNQKDDNSIVLNRNINITYGSNSNEMTNILGVMSNSLNKLFEENTIKNINIYNLFGVFNYRVSFNNTNVFVIHAPNGCGKSHFLNYISDFLNARTNDLCKGPFEKIEIETKHNNYGIEPFKTKDLVVKNVPKCNYIGDLYNYNFEVNAEINNISNEDRIRIFQEIMDQFFCFEKKVQIINSDKDKTKKIIITYDNESSYTNPSILKKGDNIEFSEMSSGEKFIIKLFYKLIFDLAYNSFVIIDEPEMSLHVEWQELMIKNIVKVANTFEVYILIATHSPYIVNNPYVEVGAVEYEEA